MFLFLSSSLVAISQSQLQQTLFTSTEDKERIHPSKKVLTVKNWLQIYRKSGAVVCRSEVGCRGTWGMRGSHDSMEVTLAEMFNSGEMEPEESTYTR